MKKATAIKNNFTELLLRTVHQNGGTEAPCKKQLLKHFCSASFQNRCEIKALQKSKSILSVQNYLSVI